MKKRTKILLIFISLVLIGAIFLFLTPKGHDIRRFAAETIMSTQHRGLAKWTFLSQKEMDEILNNINNPKYSNTIVAPSVQKEGLKTPTINKDGFSIPSEDAPLIVNVETIKSKDGSGSFYEGKIMTVSNPHNVKLKSAKTLNQGEQIFVLAKKVHAIAATNASGFYDPNGVGNGGQALGIVIENGVNKNTSEPDYVAALTKSGQLLTGVYSPNELLDLGVQSAAGFKPQLIANGKKMITNGDGGWGAGPRTAIGQTKDGKIIFIVIDGRQPTRSIGATIKDVQNLMYERGVVNAICMDGGSSASMYLNGDNITTPSSVGHVPRYLPNIWAVIPKEGQKVKVTYDDDVIINENKYSN